VKRCTKGKKVEKQGLRDRRKEKEKGVKKKRK
jgi:hypothetical protein